MAEANAELVTVDFKGHKADIVRYASIQLGYQESVPDPANPGQSVPNPQPREEFVMRWVLTSLVDLAMSAKQRLDREQVLTDLLNQGA